MHYFSYCFSNERTSIIPFDVLNFITSPVGRAHRHTSLSCKPSLPKTRIARGTDHKKRMIFFIQLLSFYLFIVSRMKEIFVTASFRFYDRETLGCSPLRVIAMKTKKKEKKIYYTVFFRWFTKGKYFSTECNQGALWLMMKEFSEVVI